MLCAIGAGISLEDYDSSPDWCVVSATPFYVTVLIPISLLFIFNTTCLLAITYTLVYKTNGVPTTRPVNHKVRFRIILGFIVLFGLTWLFGFFVVSNSSVVFQYMFCGLSCSNGLYLFVFYGVGVAQNRWAWWKLVRCVGVKEIERLHTKRRQMSRYNTNDVSSPLYVNSDSSNANSSSLLKSMGKSGTTL